jgi:hypothetical protein
MPGWMDLSQYMVAAGQNATQIVDQEGLVRISTINSFTFLSSF